MKKIYNYSNSQNLKKTMIKLNSSATKFFESMNSFPLAFGLIDSLINDNKLNDEVFIHFVEEKNKAYLKINSRRPPIVVENDRSILSMYSHPSKNIFVCRAAWDVAEEVWVSNIRKVNLPLPVKFNLNLTDKLNGQIEQWRIYKWLNNSIESKAKEIERDIIRDNYYMIS